MPNPRVFSRIDKAVHDYNLIESGDRILIGASGGKDSTLLIEYFSRRLLRPDSNFTFKALHIKSEFSGSLPENIQALFESWNVCPDEIEIDVQGRLKPGKKMSCYWCSTQRRIELMNYAMDNGYNKIALGHHMDDILETLIMNTLHKSEFSTMIPRMQYKNYPVTLIRPLCYCLEENIIEHAREHGYYGWTCTCNFQDNSFRKDARRRLALFTDGSADKKEKFFWSLKNIDMEYLP